MRPLEGELLTPCPTCYGFREDHGAAGCPATRRAAPRPGDSRYLEALGLAVRALRAIPPEARHAALDAVPLRYRKIARAALALLAATGN